MSYYDDGGKLDYPTAERLVLAYIEAHDGRSQTTSVDVLRWSDYGNSHHNRQRVFETLQRAGEEINSNWSGRTVFKLPDEA